MIFEIYSKILTDHGFVDIKEKINEKGYKLAYINDEGRLDFTDCFKITRGCPEHIVSYSDKLFINTRSSEDSMYFSDSLNNPLKLKDTEVDDENSRHILSSYDCFLGEHESSGKVVLNFEDKPDLKIRYKDFLKLVILHMCFSSINPTDKDSTNVKYYLKTKAEFVNVARFLDKAISKEYYGIYAGATSYTIYIDSPKLAFILKNIDDFLHRVMTSSTLSSTFCTALEELGKDLHYSDKTYVSYSVLLGRNLNKYIHYIAGYLSVNGYKLYFRRMPDKKYKLMFTKQCAQYFVGDLSSSYNKAHYTYYDIHTTSSLPMFVLETVDWVSSVSLRASFDDYYYINSNEADYSICETSSCRTDDISDIFGGL